MKLAIIGILLLLTITIGASLQNSKITFSPKASEVSSPEIIIGPEEQVFTTSSRHMPDLHYVVVKTPTGQIGALSVGGVGGVEGSQREYQVSNPLSSKLGALTPMIGFVKGTKRSDPDFGGVWLAATKMGSESNVIHGINYAETHSGTAPPSLANTIFTANYIRSNDGGKTWFKPNYPNNVIMTGTNNPTKVGGSSPTSLVQVGDKVYLYSQQGSDDAFYNGMSVAKLTGKEIGNPASWKKYYCQSAGNCGFTEPAIGGKITVLPGLSGKSPVSYNSFINKYLALNGSPLLENNTLNLSYSDDGINFQPYGKPITLNNPLGPGWTKAYSSLIGLDGTQDQTNRQFYWYYVVLKRDPKTQVIVDPQRYLMRRLITLTSPTVPQNPQTLSAKLYRFYDPKDSLHIYSNTDRSSEGLNAEAICCKIADTQILNTVPLYKVRTSTDFFMEIDTNQIMIAEANGYQNKTILGYCYPRGSQPTGTAPLYRFYSPKYTDHFYTTSETEKSLLTSGSDYKFEGIVCYVNP